MKLAILRERYNEFRTPANGDWRRVSKFAWCPKRVEVDLDSDELNEAFVWLETYLSVQRYVVGPDGENQWFEEFAYGSPQGFSEDK